MPRPKAVIPSYSRHSPSGQACVYIDRRRVYLGRYNSPESKRRYSEELEKLATGRQAAVKPNCGSSLTVAELCLKFLTRAAVKLSRSEGLCFKSAIRVCVHLFGETPVSEFGPVKFRLMRDAMVDGDPQRDRTPWCRKTANRQAKRIRQIFRWGASWELVPVEVVTKLETVRALAVGETHAVDYAPRAAVPPEDLEAVRGVLKPLHRDVFDMLCLTGARPGEILNLTGGLIERRPDGFWSAELSDHKTARKGKRRLLIFGTKAQAILLRYLKADPAAKLFRLRRDNFGAAIGRACVRANVPPFVPHQLRHSVATILVDELGIEHAQAMLGHSDQSMTLHYSRMAEKRAIEAAVKLG